MGRGQLEILIMWNTPATLKMNDYLGNWLTLQRMESHQAECMLGVQLAADKKMQVEFKLRLSQAQTWAALVVAYKADTITQWLNFQMVLLPKISYSLMATTFTKEECENMLRPAILQLLLAIGINQNFPWLMNRSYNHTQSQYSTAYWKQPNKLGTQLETIDWNKISKVCSGLPIDDKYGWQNGPWGGYLWGKCKNGNSGQPISKYASFLKPANLWNTFCYATTLSHSHWFTTSNIKLKNSLISPWWDSQSKNF